MDLMGPDVAAVQHGVMILFTVVNSCEHIRTTGVEIRFLCHHCGVLQRVS